MKVVNLVRGMDAGLGCPGGLIAGAYRMRLCYWRGQPHEIQLSLNYVHLFL